MQETKENYNAMVYYRTFFYVVTGKLGFYTYKTLPETFLYMIYLFQQPNWCEKETAKWCINKAEKQYKGVTNKKISKKEVDDYMKKQLIIESMNNKKCNKRVPLSPKKRFIILKRDKFKCQYCGISAEESRLEIDHKKPISKGGTNDEDNLITACFECNRGKRDFKL